MSHATNVLLLDAPLLHLGKALATQGSFNRACHFLESMTGEKPLCWYGQLIHRRCLEGLFPHSNCINKFH